MSDEFNFTSYDTGMVSNGDENYSDSYYDVPKNFTSPEFYSPDVNATVGGTTSVNATPSTAEKPTSLSSFVNNTFNKVLDTSLAVAKNRFGNSKQPTSAQGGVVQGYTGNPNPAPGNLLSKVYESTAQPNQTVGAGVLTGSSGLWMGLAALALLLVFMSRR